MKVMLVGAGNMSVLQLELISKNHPNVIVFAGDDIDFSNENMREMITPEVYKFTSKNLLLPSELRDYRLPQLPEKQTYAPPVTRKSKRW